jgi:hypothetical protein
MDCLKGVADKAAGCYGTGGGGVIVCCVRGGGEVSGNPAGDAQAANGLCSLPCWHCC